MEFVGCTAAVWGGDGVFNFAIAIAYSRVLYRMGSLIFFSFLVDQVNVEPDVVLHLILERGSGGLIVMHKLPVGEKELLHLVVVM
jgi:hypothetical protein